MKERERDYRQIKRDTERWREGCRKILKHNGSIDARKKLGGEKN